METSRCQSLNPPPCVPEGQPASSSPTWGRVALPQASRLGRAQTSFRGQRPHVGDAHRRRLGSRTIAHTPQLCLLVLISSVQPILWFSAPPLCPVWAALKTSLLGGPEREQEPEPALGVTTEAPQSPPTALPALCARLYLLRASWGRPSSQPGTLIKSPACLTQECGALSAVSYAFCSILFHIVFLKIHDWVHV